MRLIYLFIPLLSSAIATASCKKKTDSPSIDTTTQEQGPGFSSDDSTAGVQFIVRSKAEARVVERQWQGIPTITSSLDGKTIYVAWYTGGKGEGPGNFITVSTSNDYGKTWLSNQLILYPLAPDVVRFFDPCLWRDHNNDIWLFWSRSNNWWDGYAGVWAIKLNMSKDGITHTKALRLADGVMINKPIELIGKNKTLLPISLWHQAPVKTSTGTFIYENAKSDNRIDSIKKLSSVTVPPAIRIFDEHQIVETQIPGKLLLFVRTLKGIYWTRSVDYGVTWDTISAFKAAGNTASARFNIMRLKSGNLILTMNASTGRTNMKVFLSKDNGESWPHSLLLDTRNNISYPDVELSNDGIIHVVYDRERFKEKQILYCSFTEKDVLSGDVSKIRRVKVDGD